MTPVRSSTLSALALGTLLGLLSATARAQPQDPAGTDGAGGGGSALQTKSLHVEARPLLGPASLCPGGWGEVLVRIANSGGAKATGQVSVLAAGTAYGGSFGSDDSSRAPFAVAAGATVSLRIPIRVAEHDEPLVRVVGDGGRKIHEQSLQRASGYDALLVDVSQASALGAALRGMPVPARNDPYGSPYASRAWGGPSGASLVLAVASPLYDPATGDPVLPQRAAAYSQVAAVLLRSETLARTPAAELEALSSYLLAGGTLALVVTRPEDLRHPTLVALTGGEVARTAPHELASQELTLSAPGTGSGPFGSAPDKRLPQAGRAEAALDDQLAGYSGGNLQPSLYGSSATYGLGEVHLLPFDPTRKPAVDSPFVQLRMVDLVRRATERRSGTLLFPGGYHNPVEAVRRQLDPNEGSRWAIVLAALLLCIYSVVAGPLNFAFWRRRGKPLRALLYLPLLAGATFGAVVVIGVVAKGCRGQARHLTVVEAGAGMHRGAARRWRGFFVPSARKLTVRTNHASSVVSSARMDMSDASRDQLLVDRDGARLVELSLRPWQTVVIREDGLADLGEGVALVDQGAGEILVANHTGRRLRGLVLHAPGAPDLSWLAQLEPGASASSSAFTPLSGGYSIRTTTGGLTFTDFNVYAVQSELERVSSGLGDAWEAVATSTLGDASWFPPTVPTLLAQLDGGEGITTDSGLTVDSDRVLIRIVGFGGGS
ncbi:MAG: hypothetical protein JRI23_27845 [Deltaproteobacteria bacterium]|nr:hypothetical protein [Deltaproteobacteria bacterium]MBW2535904.1 hypothetical protein [Deltaproteobacteria bacterium]